MSFAPRKKLSFGRSSAGALALAALLGCASDGGEKQTPSEIMPITAANLRGHQALYHEGWQAISSTEKALDFAHEHSVTASGEAMRQALGDIAADARGYRRGLKDSAQGGVQTSRGIFQRGTEISGEVIGGTTDLIRAEHDWGNAGMRAAWSRFYLGHVQLAERTEEDRAALRKLPGETWQGLKEDFSNLAELSRRTDESLSTKIRADWDKAFAEAKAEARAGYKESGERGNSFMALGALLAGYARSLYVGLAKPAARSLALGGEGTARGAAQLIFLPVASVFIVSGRTVSATGLSLFYSARLGYRLVSPTIEGGLLAAISLLSYAAEPVTAAAGYSAGAINQVAITAAAPAAGAVQATAQGTVATVALAAQVSYDALKGVTRVTFNQLQSGVVLGYNALTALPTQALLAAANGVVFLAWDGPRLVIASAQGKVQWRDAEGREHSAPLGSLPVGSVVDLRQLRQEPGVQVQILSEDAETIEKVLEKIPADSRVPQTGTAP